MTSLLGQTVQLEKGGEFEDLGVVVAVEWCETYLGWKLLVMDGQGWLTSWNYDNVRVKQ